MATTASCCPSGRNRDQSVVGDGRDARARDRESLANDRLCSQVSRPRRRSEGGGVGRGEYQQRVRVEALLQQLQIQKAEELFGAQHRSQEAVAVRWSAADQPSNAVAAARLVSALTRPFSQPLSVPMTHDHWVPDGDFSSDGTRVATGSWDGTARIWNAKTGEPVRDPCVTGGDPLCPVQPRRTALVTCSGDRTARYLGCLDWGIGKRQVRCLMKGGSALLDSFPRAAY